MTVLNHHHHHGVYLNVTRLCPQNISSYITNLTASYTDQSNEPTIVSSSVIMFVLAGLFFNLNLFSGISDVSAILDPKVRLFLTSALSLFLPVMSYLFSEAKNARYTTSSGSTVVGADAGDLSLTAGLILVWMLLVELLRKKVDEIRMRGYSGTIQRAGRVAWLGSLVFFNIRSTGRKAVFSILWILCATKVAQRIAFTEVGKRSYAHGKNAAVITSYMAQMLDDDDDRGPGHGDNVERHHDHPSPAPAPAPAGGDHVLDVVVEVEHHGEQQEQGGRRHAGSSTTAAGIGNELLRRCNYIVMGEKKLVKKATADGYEFNDVATNDSIVTVGKVWELATDSSSDDLFAHYDKNQRLKRLCLSFALFKLLRRRFEHLPAMSDSEAHDCRNLILNGLYKSTTTNNNGDGGDDAAEALFQVMSDEVNFLSEYYHSVIPVVFASPFFLVANYLLLPAVVTVLCLMSVILCGNGDASYAFGSLGRDNYTLRSGVPKIVLCLVAKAANKSPPAFFSLVDLAITIFLFVIFFYEEIWEFLVFLLSNWFMVSVLCDYTAKRQWRESPTFSGAFCRLLWLRSKIASSSNELKLKQFSVLNLRWPLLVPLFASLSMAVRSEPATNTLKRAIIDCLVRHGRDDTPLTNGASALEKHCHQCRLSMDMNELTWAFNGGVRYSVAEVILTWHVATDILEVEHSPTRRSNKEEVTLARVATRLSRYCTYLVAFHPELLPDNKEKAESVFDDMKAELKNTLGCPAYFFSSRKKRVKRIMESVVVQGEEGRPMSDDADIKSRVVLNGAKLAGKLLREETVVVWKVLADVWTELIVFVAPSNEEERVKGHEQVLVQGGEFITVLWALTTHIGVARPTTTTPSNKRTSGCL